MRSHLDYRLGAACASSSSSGAEEKGPRRHNENEKGNDDRRHWERVDVESALARLLEADDLRFRAAAVRNEVDRERITSGLRGTLSFVPRRAQRERYTLLAMCEVALVVWTDCGSLARRVHGPVASEDS